MAKRKPLLGVIGGTALERIEGEELFFDSDVFNYPFDRPSEFPRKIRLPNNQIIVVLNRHGEGHRIPPHMINFRANVYALKQMGVTHVVSISACGSLQEEIVPGKTVVIPTQFKDCTHGRERTFFDDIAVHIGLGEPACPEMSNLLRLISCIENAVDIAVGNDIACQVINGPHFQPRVDSIQAHKDGLHVVGMNGMPEAALLREAEICAGFLYFPADYDSWREDCVDGDMVKKGLEPFGDLAMRIVANLATCLSERTCNCKSALRGSAVHAELATLPDRSDLMRKYAPLGLS